MKTEKQIRCRTVVVAASAVSPRIDLIAANDPEIGLRMTGGLAWLDRQMEAQNGTSFVGSTSEEQRAMLDKISYQERAAPDIGSGVEFFWWARRLTVDALYTSPIESKMSAMKAAALEYAAKRSGLTEG